MTAKRIAVWGLVLVGFVVAVAGFILTPDVFKATLPTDEAARLTVDVVSTLRWLQVTLIVSGVLLIALGVILYRFGRQGLNAMTSLLQLESQLLEDTPNRLAVFDLFLISFLGLFFEVLIIRWLSTEVRLFAYYKNLSLIAAFMGLGIGFMLARKKLALLPVFPIGFCALSAIILVGAAKGVFLSLSNPAGSDVWIWGILQRSALPSFFSFFALIPFFFLSTVLVFIPLGQATGQAMQLFPPIKAYTINVLGSLAGTWGFSALSFMSWPPLAWFAIGLVLCLWFLRRTRRALVINAVASALFIIMAFVLRGDSYWSPYYRIDVKPITAQSAAGNPVRWGYALDVNYDFHQSAVNLSPDFARQNASVFPTAPDESAGYAIPYRLLKPRTVLVVGAGAGNDVATALRQGAEHVDAVDIDPVILHIGQNIHPERPYDSSRVTLIVDDARSYFNKTQRQYDLIVYGMLDSHTLFSNMSSLRLDNFVYTVEGIREARQHLSDRGAVAIFFLAGKDWIAQKLFNVITAAFGQEPVMLNTTHGTLYLIGPGFTPAMLSSLPSDTRYEIVKTSYDSQDLVVDDWPFLYLREHVIPSAYWQVLALLAVISVVVILAISPKSLRVNWHFFLLGAAFLLLEIKSVTDLALLFGSTWIVNSLVISAILVMVLAANFYVQRFKLLDMRIYYLLLVISLLLGYLLPLGTLLGQNVWLRAALGSLVVSLPLFFAGIIFSTSLKKIGSVEVAFGSNLLGSVLGGLLEYSSLVLGLRNLMLLALVMYVGSFLALGRGQGK
jgi:hypothetical protein